MYCFCVLSSNSRCRGLIKKKWEFNSVGRPSKAQVNVKGRSLAVWRVEIGETKVRRRWIGRGKHVKDVLIICIRSEFRKNAHLETRLCTTHKSFGIHVESLDNAVVFLNIIYKSRQQNVRLLFPIRALVFHGDFSRFVQPRAYRPDVVLTGWSGFHVFEVTRNRIRPPRNILIFHLHKTRGNCLMRIRRSNYNMENKWHSTQRGANAIQTRSFIVFNGHRPIFTFRARYSQSTLRTFFFFHFGLIREHERTADLIQIYIYMYAIRTRRYFRYILFVTTCKQKSDLRPVNSSLNNLT